MTSLLWPYDDYLASTRIIGLRGKSAHKAFYPSFALQFVFRRRKKDFCPIFVDVFTAAIADIASNVILCCCIPFKVPLVLD